MSEYIYNGTYGCVIHPNIDCKQNFGNKLNITKFFYNEEGYIEELKLQYIIEKIDPSSKFSVKKINNCQIALSKETKDRIVNIKKCKLNSDNVFIISYEYGGIDINNLFTNDKYVSILNHIDFNEFLKKFINIFEAVCEINKNKYIHFDIRLPNILYNHETEKFVIIDFGIMKNIDDNEDIHYLNNIKIHHPNYPNEFYSYNSKTFYNLFIKDIINKITNKYINIISKYLLSNYDKNITRDTSKIDVYMLGLSLFHILIFINIKNPNIIFPDRIFFLISKMINKNSENRITIQQATEEYKSIINSI